VGEVLIYQTFCYKNQNNKNTFLLNLSASEDKLSIFFQQKISMATNLRRISVEEMDSIKDVEKKRAYLSDYLFTDSISDISQAAESRKIYHKRDILKNLGSKRKKAIFLEGYLKNYAFPSTINYIVCSFSYPFICLVSISHAISLNILQKGFHRVQECLWRLHSIIAQLCNNETR